MSSSNVQITLPEINDDDISFNSEINKTLPNVKKPKALNAPHYVM